MIHTVKGFGIVNKAEIDVFLELSCFFHDPADVGNLISRSSAFSQIAERMKFTPGLLCPLQPACSLRAYSEGWEKRAEKESGEERQALGSHWPLCHRFLPRPAPTSEILEEEESPGRLRRRASNARL